VTETDFPRWPQVTDDDIEAVVRVLYSGRLSRAMDETVAEFERAVAEYQGCDHAVAVSSGTAALHLALTALGITPNSEVVVPAHTFVGTVSPVVYLRATPVFADVDGSTYCMTAEATEARLTEHTRGIIVVHLNGCPADPEIYPLAAAHGIPVVDDAAQALGARMGGEPVGARGAVAILSFFEQKVITCGEGGMVLTNDASIASRVRLLRSHGEAAVQGAPGLLWASEIGFNYRMTALQAALGRSQLRRLEEFIAVRRANAADLTARLRGIDWLAIPVEPSNSRHSYWRYVIRLKSDRLGWGAQEAAASLREAGIPASIRYPYPVHLQPAFARPDIKPCPISERLSRELIALPVYPGLSEAHLDRIAATVESLPTLVPPNDLTRP
jgi:perosamine synthetase